MRETRRKHRGDETTHAPPPTAEHSRQRRNPSRPKAFAATLALLALLIISACDDVRSPPVHRHTTVEITAVGGPLDTTGLTYPLTIELQINDENGQRVRFNRDLTADHSGAESVITLPPGTTRARVQLPIGKTFHLTLRGVDGDGTHLSTGEDSVQAGSTPVAVVVQLRSLLGGGQLVPRLPITRLIPGQTIDLLHTVTPNKREDLLVPEHELSVTYGGNIEVLTFSSRGARVKAGSREDGDVIVTAKAGGLKLSSDGVQPGVVTSTFTRPFTTGINADLIPPIVKTVTYDPQNAVLTGVATDDQSLKRLDVYDGPHLLATTDPEDSLTKDVPIVAFPAGGTTFMTRIPLLPGEYELTILAADLSGNQTTVTHDVVIP